MSEVPVVIQGFKGLNLREPAGMVQDDELTLCENFNIGRAGELTKRTGFAQLHNGNTLGLRNVSLLGHYLTATKSQIIAATSNGGIWSSPNGADWTRLQQDAVTYAYQDALDEFELDEADLTIVGVEEVTWANSSLGCPVDGEIYTTVDTPGYRILLQNTATSTYYYYNGENGQLPVRCDTPNWTNVDFTADPELQVLVPVTVTANAAVQYVNNFYIATDAGVYVWNGEVLELIPDSPVGTFCLVYKDRLYVLSSKAENNNRLYFSAIAEFDSWPSTNFFDVNPGDGDFLTSCAIIQDLLLIFKTGTSWALYVQGAPQNWVLRNINPEIGCISSQTPREIEGFLYFVGTRGIYKTDGNIFEDISESIEPIFRERIVNLTTVNIDSASWWEDRFIVLLHPTPSTYRYLVYHLRTEGWTEWVPAAGIRPTSFLEIVSASPSKGLYTGNANSDGRIYRHGGGALTDAGSFYPCKLRTKDFDFALPSMMKRGKWLGIDVAAGEGNTRIRHTVDEEELAQLTFTGQTSRRLHKVEGPGYFRVWNLELEYEGSKDYIFYSTTLFMHRKRSTIKAYT